MNETITLVTIALLPLFAALPASAAGLGDEMIAVTTTDDSVDFGGGQQVADLPGPDGQISFREAVVASNNTAGRQTIGFNVPESEWWLYDDRALLRCYCDPFIITDAVTVDARTQTDFTGDTNPDGSEVAFWGEHPNCVGGALIIVQASDCTFYGLGVVQRRGYAIQTYAGAENTRVYGCTISGPYYAAVQLESSNNTIGGTAVGEGNRLSSGGSGVRVDQGFEDPAPVNNRIIGNYLTGSSSGVHVRAGADHIIGGPTPAERNVIADVGYYGEEGFPVGDHIRVSGASGTIIEGNYIGLTADGTQAAGAVGPTGIEILSAADTVVRNNVIAEMVTEGTNHAAGQRFGRAIDVLGNSSNTLIAGNLMGTDASGATPIPNRAGITFSSFPSAGVPSGALIAGNLIAYSELDGVQLGDGVQGVTISMNAIHENDELGIELIGSANRGQAAPVLTAAGTTGTTVTVEGTASGPANAALTLEFFGNTACDPAGSGEGAEFLGGHEVTTDGSGQVAFSVTLSTSVTVDEVITATTTRQSTGATSAFSACQPVMETGMPGDSNCDGQVNWRDIDTFVAAQNDNVSGWIALHEQVYGQPPGCPFSNNDVNGDGTANWRDVDPFVALMGR